MIYIASLKISVITNHNRGEGPSEAATVGFYKKSVLKIYAKYTEKHLRQSLFFNKVAGLRLTTLLKGDSGTSVFL